MGQDLAAGEFSAWRRQMLDALGGGEGSDVPCGACTACCRSSYFIHVEPDELDTLRHIPRPLLFPAPGRPRGHMVMGYDEEGRCPMLVDDRCSIYEHRPRTCRRYDCRVFPAAGLAPDDDGKALIAEQAARWRFDFATALARREREAVRRAAAYLDAHPECLPDGRPAPGTGALAVMALRASVAFLQDGDPDPAAVRRALA